MSTRNWRFGHPTRGHRPSPAATLEFKRSHFCSPLHLIWPFTCADQKNWKFEGIPFIPFLFSILIFPFNFLSVFFFLIGLESLSFDSPLDLYHYFCFVLKTFGEAKRPCQMDKFLSADAHLVDRSLENWCSDFFIFYTTFSSCGGAMRDEKDFQPGGTYGIPTSIECAPTIKWKKK